MAAFFYGQMLRICPQYDQAQLWWCISTAAWRLLVQTCCKKAGKTATDSSDNARAAYLRMGRNNNFSGCDTRTEYRTMSATLA